VEEIKELIREKGCVVSATVRTDGHRIKLQGEGNEILTVKLPKKVRTGEQTGPYHTVYELWQPSFRSMVVRNCETGKSMLLLGKDGKLPLRDEKPVGYYAAELNPGYDYSSKRYTLWGADKSIWILEKSVTDHKGERRAAGDKRSFYDPVCHTLEELWKRSGRRTFHIRHAETGASYCLVVERRKIVAVRRADPDTGLLSEQDCREEIRPLYREPVWYRL